MSAGFVFRPNGLWNHNIITNTKLNFPSLSFYQADLNLMSNEIIFLICNLVKNVKQYGFCRSC